MTAGSTVVKATAKTALKANWLKIISASCVLIFAYFINFLLTSVITYVYENAVGFAFSFVMTLCVLIPLFFGYLRFVWRLIFGADDLPIEIFYYFSSFKKYSRALKLIMILFFKSLCIGILLFLPSILMDIFATEGFYELFNLSIPLWSSGLYYFSLFLKILATAILVLVMLRYYLAPFLMISDENMLPSEAIYKASILSKDSFFDILTLILTFIGWFAVCILVFPLIFVLPYFTTSLAVHTRFVIAEYNLKNKKLTKKFDSSFESNF